MCPWLRVMSLQWMCKVHTYPIKDLLLFLISFGLKCSLSYKLHWMVAVLLFSAYVILASARKVLFCFLYTAMSCMITRFIPNLSISVLALLYYALLESQ